MRSRGFAVLALLLLLPVSAQAQEWTAEQQEVWQALEANLQPSDILVVSTHRPLMASRLVNRVMIMQQGRVVRDGSPESLLPQMARQTQPPPAAKSPNVDVV